MATDPTTPENFARQAVAMENAPASMATIMIVEDDDDLVSLLSHRLRKEGFDTVVAWSGEEACRLITEIEIDLVLLDILMPGMDGWAVCRRLRGHYDPRIATIPVIMLTALSAGENRIKGLECGANAYLAKPYSIREVALNCQRLITERRERLRLQTEVTALRDKEQGESDAQRILFHELRSHFTVIGGLCGRMLNIDDPHHLTELARERGYLEVIRASVNQVAEMADEMLLLSKLGKAELCLPRDYCRLDEIVSELLAVYSAKAQTKGISLAVSPLPSQPVRLHRLALKIILSSLLENAIKYSPPGALVTLRATVAGRKLRLEVEDQGPGIPLSEQEKIFEPYFRGEAVRASQPGSGLGLYSVKRLTEALNGVVNLTSTPEKGSLFAVLFDVS